MGCHRYLQVIVTVPNVGIAIHLRKNNKAYCEWLLAKWSGIL